jgi:anion-transporting  ArsA/GET3 family ATPase
MCASLALLASKMGKRVLVVEIDSSEVVAEMFGRKRRIGYREVEIFPNIYTINVIPQESLEEYLRMRLKYSSIYNTLFSRKVFKYFTSAAPGLRELVTIGKIWHLATRINEKTQKPKYDIVIVDSPATGHGISFIKLPQVVIDAVKVGPVKKEAQKVTSLLWDHDKTIVNIVSLAEEMPVNETIEMYNLIKKELNIQFGYILVNAVYSPIFDENEKKILNDVEHIIHSRKQNPNTNSNPFIKYAKTRINRRDLNLFHINRLKEALPGIPIIEIPYIFSKNHDINAIEKISAQLGSKFGL